MIRSGSRAHRQLGCEGKRPWVTEYVARAVAQSAIQKGIFDGAKAWVYSCRFCGRWHITSSFSTSAAPGAVTADQILVGVRA